MITFDDPPPLTDDDILFEPETDLRVVRPDEHRSANAKDALGPEAPVGDGVVIPLGWRAHEAFGSVGQYRLFRVVTRRDKRGNEREEELPVAYYPIVISSILVGVDDDEASVEVAWQADRTWYRRIVSRRRLKQTRDLIDALSGANGFPADANNAKELVRYLTDFEAVNMHCLPTNAASNHFGWQRGGRMGFLAGKEHVGGGRPVVFVGADDGERQLVNAVKRHGTFEGWAEGARLAAYYPSVRLGMYAALSSAMLEVLSVPNYAVDFSHKTSTGKTTTLSIAASCWGQPDPNSPHSYLSSWFTTSVGLERRAATLTGLPMVLDDTKTAKSYGGRSEVPAIVYRIVSGEGKLRGSKAGLAEVGYWRTVLISSGEQRIVDFSKDGGTAGRVVSLWGNPFGAVSDATADAIRRIKLAIYNNYGHAGPRLVEWLLAHRGEWEELRREHSAAWDRITERMKQTDSDALDLNVLGRIACCLALIEVTARCAHQAMDLPWKLTDPIGPVLPSVAQAASVADRELEALKYAISWAVQNRARFCTDEDHRRRKEPAGGWLGFWEAADTVNWDVLAFFPGALREFLEKQGFEPKSTFRRWREEGWLHATESGRSTSKLYVLPDKPRMIQITREAAEMYGDICGGGEEPLPF